MLNYLQVTQEVSAQSRPKSQAITLSVGAARRSPGFQVLTSSIPITLDSERIFRAFYGDAEYAFWLDSSLQPSDLGRYSIMGDASGPLSHIVTADIAAGTVSLQQGLEVTTRSGSVFDLIAKQLQDYRIDGRALPEPFSLGYVGFLGYELKANCEGKSRHHSPHPDAGLIFADRALVVDHASETVHLLCLTAEQDANDAIQWLEESVQRLQDLTSQPLDGFDDTKLFDNPPRARLRSSRDEYLKQIHICQEAIANGESYEVCLTTQIHGQGKLDPLATYCRLRRQNPAPFSSFLRLGSLAVLSSSPERFLALSRNRILETRPIKGTAPRSADAVEDANLADELSKNEKTRAENLMIVDLCRNDLGRCAEIGSVTVSKLFDVESYATVHQLVSTVRAKLRSDLTAIDAVRACFPGGSMTGAPKLRTMEIIDDLEGAARGIYSGALGYFSLCGAIDLSMVIRTLIVHEERFSIGTGGAILAQSDADSEFDEMLLKAKSLLQLLGLHSRDL